VLNVHQGASRTFEFLLETFRPTRLVAFDLETQRQKARFVIPERAEAFDGVFLLGLLPRLVGENITLFDEVTRVLAGGGILVASSPLAESQHLAPARRPVRRASAVFSLKDELARGRLDLVEAHTGVNGVGRLLIVGRKRSHMAASCAS
jgi:hypothetical protein